jgi:hypothetical protein
MCGGLRKNSYIYKKCDKNFLLVVLYLHIFILKTVVQGSAEGLLSELRWYLLGTALLQTLTHNLHKRR